MLQMKYRFPTIVKSRTKLFLLQAERNNLESFKRGICIFLDIQRLKNDKIYCLLHI